MRGARCMGRGGWVGGARWLNGWGTVAECVGRGG